MVLAALEGLQSPHGNAGCRLDGADKLGALRRPTLRGNPMEEEQGYRRYVLALPPRLGSPAFGAVTRQERGEAAACSQPSTQHPAPARLCHEVGQGGEGAQAGTGPAAPAPPEELSTAAALGSL